jgi:hypothetical protein
MKMFFAVIFAILATVAVGFIVPSLVEPGLFLGDTSEGAVNSASPSVEIIGKVGLRGNGEILGDHR